MHQQLQHYKKGKEAQILIFTKTIYIFTRYHQLFYLISAISTCDVLNPHFLSESVPFNSFLGYRVYNQSYNPSQSDILLDS